MNKTLALTAVNRRRTRRAQLIDDVNERLEFIRDMIGSYSRQVLGNA